jgi:hypothetical protein
VLIVARSKMEGKSLIENRSLPIMLVRGGKMAQREARVVIQAPMRTPTQRIEVIHNMKSMVLED